MPYMGSIHRPFLMITPDQNLPQVLWRKVRLRVSVIIEVDHQRLLHPTMWQRK